MSQISIIMPVFNGEAVLKTAIEGILVQSFSDFEFIIVDDGSIDQTGQIIRSYNDKRIKVIHNAKKKGVAAALNIGLKRVRSPYVARMDVDDIATQDRLAIQWEFLNKHGDVGLVCSWVKLIDNSGKVIGRLHYPSSDARLKKLLFRRNCIIHPTVMLRSALLLEHGGYDENLDGAEDYDLWLRLALYTKFHTISRELLWYRRRRSSVSYLDNRRVLSMTIKAKIKAMREYGYPLNNMYALFPPILSLLIPNRLKSIYYRIWYGYD